MSGIHYIVGLEPAVEELLRRTDAIDESLIQINLLLEKLAMTFEEKTQLLINYAKALKDQVAGLENGEAEATIAALRAEVAATAAALAAAQGEIAADTAQEEFLGAQIDELLPAPPVVEPEPEGPPFGTPGPEVLDPEPPADEQPMPEPPFVEEDPIVTPDPIVEPEPVVEPTPEPISSDDMVA